MANIITATDIVVDTPGAALVFTAPLKVKYVRWDVIAGSAGYRATIQDKRGKLLWEKTTDEPDFSNTDRVDGWWTQGISVPTLEAGKLYIGFA